MGTSLCRCSLSALSNTIGTRSGRREESDAINGLLGSVPAGPSTIDTTRLDGKEGARSGRVRIPLLHGRMNRDTGRLRVEVRVAFDTAGLSRELLIAYHVAEPPRVI